MYKKDVLFVTWMEFTDVRYLSLDIDMHKNVQVLSLLLILKRTLTILFQTGQIPPPPRNNNPCMTRYQCQNYLF